MRMHTIARGAAVSVIATAAALATTAGTADAAPYRAPKVAWVNQNVILSPDKSHAEVTGKYNCVGGRKGTHLWVAVKQGPGLDQSNDPEVGKGSSNATAFYDTNWNFTDQNPAGLTVNCDGHWHVARVTVKPQKGKLSRGKAWVQWCLFDNTSNDNNFPQGFAYSYGWKTVRGAK